MKPILIYLFLGLVLCNLLFSIVSGQNAAVVEPESEEAEEGEDEGPPVVSFVHT